MADIREVNLLNAVIAVIIVGLLILAGFWSTRNNDGDDDENEPTNHAPIVELISPTNGNTLNSTTPLLVWKGSDPDGDPLVYRVKMAPVGEPLTVQHNAFTKSWRATNLTPGTSYVW